VPPATEPGPTPIEIEVDDDGPDDPRDRKASSRKRKSSHRKSGSNGTSDKPRDLDGMYPSTLRP
jgi:hypothetical protein